jgi:bifunctional DNase/RNase
VLDLEVVGVRVEMPSNNPIVLLRETTEGRYLPIWVGAVEATAIAYAQQGIEPPRPLTHDLMKDILDSLGVALTEVQITALDEGVFYATLVLSDGSHVGGRPSDAIALALRMDAPIRAAESVLDEAGIELPDEDAEVPEGDASEPVPAEDQVREFREFLDHVSPDDFG